MSKNMNRENIKQRKMGKCKLEKKRRRRKITRLNFVKSIYIETAVYDYITDHEDMET